MRTVAKRRFIGLTTMAFLAAVQIVVLVSSANLVHQIVGGIGLLTVTVGTVVMLRKIRPNFIKFGRGGYIK